MIKAIIIDDEELGRSMLKNMIIRYCPEISIIGEAGSVKEAKKIVTETNPDLIFLDIEMPGGSGFDFLEQMHDKNFSVIFTTAYDQYAVKAFRYSVTDYLLKPINVEELVNAVKKIGTPSFRENNQSAVHHLMESYTRGGISKSNKLALPTQEGLVFIDMNDIVRCEADGKYTYCFLNSGKKLYSTRSLKDFEEQLTEHGFCRIHHAHLINLNLIRNYIKGDGGQVVMSNGDTVTVSKRKKDEFIKSLNKI
jgi:two-component system LytT family response regulator